jgi:hypothetical protein
VNLNSLYLAPAVLGLLAAISLVAAIVAASRRRTIRHALRALAIEWRMTYAQYDRLRIAQRIQGRLPVPGAAALTVRDVIYGTQANHHRAVFTIEFTVGVIRANKRVRRVGSLIEPRDPRKADDAFQLAPEELPLLDQYRALDPRTAQKESSAPNGAEPLKN